MLVFLNDLRSDPQAAAFNLAVNWRALKLFDYPTIVKNPMDLQTIEEKLRGVELSDKSQNGTKYQYVH